MNRARLLIAGLAVAALTAGLVLIPAGGGAGTPNVNNVTYTGELMQGTAENVTNINVVKCRDIADGPGYTGKPKEIISARFKQALAGGNTGDAFHHMDVIYNGLARAQLTTLNEWTQLAISELPCEGVGQFTFQPKKSNGENTKNGIAYVVNVTFTGAAS